MLALARVPVEPSLRRSEASFFEALRQLVVPGDAVPGIGTTADLISGHVYELTRTPSLRDWLEEDRSRVNLPIEGIPAFRLAATVSKPRFVRRLLEERGA